MQEQRQPTLCDKAAKDGPPAILPFEDKDNGQGQKQIPFGDDKQEEQLQLQLQMQMQMQMRGSFAALRMTTFER